MFNLLSLLPNSAEFEIFIIFKRFNNIKTSNTIYNNTIMFFVEFFFQYYNFQFITAISAESEIYLLNK